VELELPPAEQVVLFPTTPAHTGADAETGPATLVPWLVPVAAVPPFGPEPVWLVVRPLPVPQVVLFAATPTQTGAEAATGPAAPAEPVPAPAATCALLPEAQLVLFAATPAHTGAETATGPVEPAWPVLTPVDMGARSVDDDPPTFTPGAEPEVATCTTVVVPGSAVPAPEPLPVWEALPLTDTEVAGLMVRLPVPPADGPVLAPVLMFDAVGTVAPACNWVALDDAPIGELVLDVTPVDVPAARAAALYRVIPRISPATMATSRTNVLTDRIVLCCIRCSS
jgi:hypothetical protein